MSNRYVITDTASEVFFRKAIARKPGKGGSFLKLAALVGIYTVCMAATPAHAESIRTRCTGNAYGAQCTTTFDGDAKPIEYTYEDLQRMKAREDKWASFCQPHEVTGRDGLPRMIYAHADCDIGRSE